MKHYILTVLASAILLNGASAAVWDFDFDFTGYSKMAEILVTNCTTEIHSQINRVLCGKATSTGCIEEPTTNPDLPHVSCVQDSIMGNVINFTLYKTDDDPATSHDPPDRQRLEMKVYNPSPIELHALNNSNYIYTHWFYLDPELFPGNPGRTFYHIFQLKAVTDLDTYPMFTLSISQDEGFHFRLREYESTSDYFPIMPWQDLLGKWYQVFIESNYKNGVSEVPNEDSGYVRVVMKDQFGRQVYPTGEESGIGYCSMFWDGMDPTTDFVRPKWGLYRNLSELHDDYDWQLFQNVQIWKKND